MTIDNLVNVTGNLLSAGSQIDASTWQTSAEITHERVTGSYEVQNVLRNKYFYVGNFAAYTVENGDAILYFGGREANPILNNLKVVCDDLIKKHNYALSSSEIGDVRDSVESGESIRIKLSELSLQRHSAEFLYFEIDTENFDKLNKTQRLFVENIYGIGADFERNMSEFKKSGINKTRVYVLSEYYVKEHVGKNGIARACWLDDFGDGSSFITDDSVVSKYFAVRGVKKFAEGDAIETPVQTMYKIFSNTTINDLASEAKPEDILKMSKVVTEYLKTQN